MPDLGTEALEQVRAQLAARPADAVFTAAEAAIYTGRSTRTLKRAIDAGVGPRREKNPDISGLGATNRHTRYRKGDLDAWRAGLVGFATGFHGFDELAMDAPWVQEAHRVAGHLLDLTSIEAMLEALANDAVAFLRLDEALGERWASPALRVHYAAQFRQILADTLAGMDAAGERDALDAMTAPAPTR